jgi:phosphoglycolate phosphatase
MQFPLAVKAAAFDLDGTLLDTLPDIAEAARRMLADLGRPEPSPEAVRRYIGDGIDQLAKRLLTGQMDGNPPAEEFEHARDLFERHYRDTLTQRTQPFLGVEEGLRRFANDGLKLACVTNKAESFTLPLLKATGLRVFFDLVVAGDTLSRKKPDPLPLLHCAQQFGARPYELLVVGDSANDALAARAAGCPVFCVPYGYSARDVRELDCDAIVSDLVEAARLITPIIRS